MNSSVSAFHGFQPPVRKSVDTTLFNKYQAVINWAVADSIDPPSDLENEINSIFYETIDPIFTPDWMHIYSTNSNSDFATINWANPGTYNAVPTNAPTFQTKLGFVNAVGSTKNYLRTQYIPSVNAVNFQASSGSFGIVFYSSGSLSSSSSWWMGSRYGTGGDLLLRNNHFRINNTVSPNPSVSTIPGSDTIVITVNRSGTTTSLYRNGVQFYSGTSAIGALASLESYVLVANENGVPGGSFGSWTLSAFTGSYITPANQALFSQAMKRMVWQKSLLAGSGGGGSSGGGSEPVGGSQGVEPDFGVPISINTYMAMITASSQIRDKNYELYGKMNLFDTLSNTSYHPGSAAPLSQGEPKVDVYFAENTRITGYQIKGATGGSRLIVMNSNDGLTYDTSATFEVGWNQIGAINVDDTTRFQRYYTQGNYPFFLKVYHDPAYSNPVYFPPAPAPDPVPQTIDSLLSSNTFVDVPIGIMDAFTTNSVHRMYNNQDWYMNEKAGLYPNDQYAFNPGYAANGGFFFDQALIDLKEVGQGAYWSAKSLSPLYGWGYVAKYVDGTPKDYNMKVSRGSIDELLYISPRDTLVYIDGNGTYKGGPGPDSVLANNTYYARDGFFTYQKTWFVYGDSLGFRREVIDSLVIVNGRLPYMIYEDNRENLPVDDYFGSRTDPWNYITLASEMSQVAMRYGKITFPDSVLKIDVSHLGNTKQSGLDLVYGIQPGNERNGHWKFKDAYLSSEAAWAMHKAVYDGFDGSMGPNIGVKTLDPSLIVLNSPTVGYYNYDYWMKTRYIEMVYKEMYPSRTERTFDRLSFHYYWHTNGGSSDHTSENRKGVVPSGANALRELDSLANFTKSYFPGRYLVADEYGADDNPGSSQAVPNAGSNYTPYQIQASYLYRYYVTNSAVPYIQMAPFYMIRDANPPPGGLYGTSGLVTYKGQYNKKDSWYMSRWFTHKLGRYRCESRVIAGDTAQPVWLLKYINEDDPTKHAYAVWKISPFTGDVATNFQITLPANISSAYETKWKWGYDLGYGKELSITNNTLTIDVDELGMLIFCQESAISSLDAPHDIYLIDSNDDSVRVGWSNEESFINSQVIEYSTDNTNWTPVVISNTETRTGWIGGLTDDTEYYIRVYNQNSAALQSARSNSVTVRTVKGGLTIENTWGFDFNEYLNFETYSNYIAIPRPAGGTPYSLTMPFSGNTLRVMNFKNHSNKGVRDSPLFDTLLTFDFFSFDSLYINMPEADTSKWYNVKVYSGQLFSSTSNEIEVTANDGQSKRVVGSQNKTELLTLLSIKPDENGLTIILKSLPGTGNGALNFLIIDELQEL